MNNESGETAAVPPASVEIALIAALDENGVIGAGGGMPWHLPADLRYFQRMTLHKPVVMGRRTFEAIGQALPKRHNLVLTSDASFAVAGCERVATLEQAQRIAAGLAAAQLMVLGGAQLFAAALPRAQRLYITRIHDRFEGDTWFPEVDWSQWQLVASDLCASDDRSTPACTFMEWQR